MKTAMLTCLTCLVAGLLRAEVYAPASRIATNTGETVYIAAYERSTIPNAKWELSGRFLCTSITKDAWDNWTPLGKRNAFVQFLQRAVSGQIPLDNEKLIEIMAVLSDGRVTIVSTDDPEAHWRALGLIQPELME